MSIVFERELRGILEADDGVLEQVVKSCTLEEREGYLSIRRNPFYVVRAAGSFGIDLVALRDTISIPIEVKSSEKRTILLYKGKPADQAKAIEETALKVGLVPIYAYRLKRFRGDAWRVYTPQLDHGKGVYRMIQNHIPKMPRTRSDNYVLRWDEGMPLSSFLGYLADVF